MGRRVGYILHRRRHLMVGTHLRRCSALEVLGGTETETAVGRRCTPVRGPWVACPPRGLARMRRSWPLQYGCQERKRVQLLSNTVLCPLKRLACRPALHPWAFSQRNGSTCLYKSIYANVHSRCIWNGPTRTPYESAPPPGEWVSELRPTTRQHPDTNHRHRPWYARTSQ